MRGAASLGGSNRGKEYWAEWLFPILDLAIEIIGETPELSEPDIALEISVRAKARGLSCPKQRTLEKLLAAGRSFFEKYFRK
jgi:hypothetical protein